MSLDTNNLFDNSELATIKKAKATEQVSKEEFEKRIRCILESKRDICWWANNFFRIVTLDRGLQIIKLYPKQEELLRFLANENRCITVAARQTGKCVFFWSLVTIKNKKSGRKIKIPIGFIYLWKRLTNWFKNVKEV